MELQRAGRGLDECADIDKTGAGRCEQEMEVQL